MKILKVWNQSVWWPDQAVQFHCVLQVLVREENPGIHYRFNPPVNRDPLSSYAWHYTSWSRCSALCAGGNSFLSVMHKKTKLSDTVYINSANFPCLPVRICVTHLKAWEKLLHGLYIPKTPALMSLPILKFFSLYSCIHALWVNDPYLSCW